MVHAKDIKIGTRLESHKMIMVVTGESEKYFIGYLDFAGRNAGECLLAKDTLTNPHYNKNLKII